MRAARSRAGLALALVAAAGAVRQQLDEGLASETAGLTFDGGNITAHDHVVPQALAAYNVLTAVRFAVQAADELRFRSSGFSGKLHGLSEAARSHLDALAAAAGGADEGALDHDAWQALDAVRRLLRRVASSCDRERRGSFIRSAYHFVFGGAPVADPELDLAADQLLNESARLEAHALAYEAEELCPMLRERAAAELRAAGGLAQAFAQRAHASLYYDVAAESFYEMTDPSDMMYVPQVPYTTILSKACFEVDGRVAQERSGSDAKAVKEEMLPQFDDAVVRASVFLGELVSKCPRGSHQSLPDDAYEVAMCVPTTRDLMMTANTTSAVLGLASSIGRKLQPVRAWISKHAAALDALFDSMSVLDLSKTSSALSSSWFSSVAWLSYRAAGSLPIREECIASAANFSVSLG